MTTTGNEGAEYLIRTDPRYRLGTLAGQVCRDAAVIEQRARMISEHLVQDNELDWETMFLDAAALELRIVQQAEHITELRQLVNKQCELRGKEDAAKLERSPLFSEVEQEDGAYVGALR